MSARPRPDISFPFRPADKTCAVEPTDIIPSTLTHIVYAFADVSPDTGSISLTDSYADEQVSDTIIACMTAADCSSQKHFPGDSWDETGNNLYGCLKQVRSIMLLLLRSGGLISHASCRCIC